MKNRFGSILLSIVIAFGLWLYVITYVSPNSEETYYNIPVVLEGESVLNERGLMCTSTSSSTVSLQLAGARSDLIKVNQNNITVKANLSAITEPGQKINLRYTISYPGNVAQNAFETLSQSDFYVDVEYRRVKDVPVVVIGGGDCAMEEANFLTRFASRVYVIHRRDELRASPIMAERAKANPKITFIWSSTVEEILGEKSVEGVRVRNLKDGTITEIACKGYFAALGHVPNTELFREFIHLDDKGYVILDGSSSRTNLAGVFAAGDCADPHYRQAITAAGMGCRAGIDAERYLESRQ